MSILTSVAADAEIVNRLPFPAWGFGAIAGSIFIVLLLVTWTYRDVANRHSHKAAPDAAAHAGAPGATHHGAGHGHDETGSPVAQPGARTGH
jgi:hypothetical protein